MTEETALAFDEKLAGKTAPSVDPSILAQFAVPDEDDEAFDSPLGRFIPVR